MRRERWIQTIAASSLVVFLASSSALSVELSTSAGRHKLSYAEDAADGAPSEVALGVAFGAFRGLFVNFLWMRANEMKDEGKYYEAVDLASTITKLQPRFPRVWQFHAWNLAYNISVQTQTPQERWKWVKAGINLLRDEGIPANPHEILLHKEIAWIYQHKIQQYMDDAHHYYKQQLAVEWTVALGPPPTLSQLGETDAELDIELKDLYIKLWLEPVRDAPETLEEVYQRVPEARVLVEKLADPEIGHEDLYKKDRQGLNILLYRFERNRVTLRAQAETGKRWARGDPFLELMSDPELFPAWVALINHLHKRVVVDEHRMDIDRMIRYTEKFGPLDWRHPAAHGVYWSHKGVEEALRRATEQNRKDFDFLNTDRLTVQAIQELFRSGDLYFNIQHPELYVALPNVEFVDSYQNHLDEVVGRSGFDRGELDQNRSRPYSFYSAGYENFLRDASRYLYRYGDIERSNEYRNKLIDYKSSVGNSYEKMKIAELRAMTLEEFIEREVREDDRFTVPTVAVQEITGSLHSAYLRGLLGRDKEFFDRNMDYARTFHTQYKDEQIFRTAVNTTLRGRHELFDENFEILAGRMLAMQIAQRPFYEAMLMYNAAPAWLRGRTYAWLEYMQLPRAYAQANQAGASPKFESVFEEPPNITLYKAELEQSFQTPDDFRGVEMR